MEKRFVSIWFRHLTTDWFTLRQPHLSILPFVLRAASHGRMIITAANATAERQGIHRGMVLADARAIVPALEVQDDKPDLIDKLLRRLAEWCIRFTPIVAVNPPDGLLLDVTGCPHLWGGDLAYVSDIERKLNTRGYDVRVAMADTVGVAWAVARFGQEPLVIPPGRHIEALMNLPPEALRLEADVVERLHKLGLHHIRQFINMPRASLRRRFGQHFLQQLDKALGQSPRSPRSESPRVSRGTLISASGTSESSERLGVTLMGMGVVELLEPVQPLEPYQERLPCMEPIVTATGIAIALQQLLETLCLRLQQEQKGIRTAAFKGYRVDGKVEQVEIVTSRPSHHVQHLFKLFEHKLSTIEPALGIELFVLEASKVEDHLPQQEVMWEGSAGLEDVRLSELVDRLASRIGMKAIHRYVPDEHYWPERSFKPALSLQEKLTTVWRSDKLRPLQLLPTPERIDVTAPIPDYPPMSFRHKGKLHTIVRADGPERIEQEWWLQQGEHRDYYRVEDEEGYRYWLFRLGHYHDTLYQWFVHGIFA